MKRVTIRRNESSDEGTFGKLTIEGGLFVCETLELPDNSNKPRISCIPKGVYICNPKLSHRFGQILYEVENVEKRGGILIHAGNHAGDVLKGFLSDSKGCVLLGQGRERIYGQWGVDASRVTLSRFMKEMKFESFSLEII